jgi:hypothetical protein
MKTKILLLSAFFLTAIFFAKSTVYVVYTSADLLAKVTAAVDGDVITLGQSDSVLTQTALTIPKRITINAASGLAAKPQLKVGFLMKNFSSLRIDGVKFFYDKPATPQANTDSHYGIQAVSETASIDSIKVLNCDISNFGRGLIRADNTTYIATIGTIVINNCTISNASSVSNTYATVGVKTAKVSNISITNSTFINGLSGVLYSTDTTTPLNLLVDHVTIYNSGKTGTKAIIGCTSPAGSTLAVTNSIIYYHGLTTAAADTLATKAIDFSASAGALTLSNSIVCPHEFSTKINPLILPLSTSSLWTNYNVVTVDSLSMDANYIVTTYPTQLNSIGDPRGYKSPSAVISPRSSSMTITFADNTINLSETGDIKIFSVAGQEVKSIQQTSSLSIANLPKGVYIVKAGNQNKGYQIQKFIFN